MHPQDLCIILPDPQNIPEENTLLVPTLKTRELELRWIKWFTKVTQLVSSPRSSGNKTYVSTLLGNEIQFQGITNVGKEGIGKDRGEANSKWCITVSFSSDLSAWSHVILWRVWTSMQNHWIPSWRGRVCSWFADFLSRSFLATSVPCGINFPTLTACHLSPLGNHCKKAEFHGSHQLVCSHWDFYHKGFNALRYHR